MKTHSSSMPDTVEAFSNKRHKPYNRHRKSKEHRYERRRVREMMHRLEESDLDLE